MERRPQRGVRLFLCVRSTTAGSHLGGGAAVATADRNMGPCITPSSLTQKRRQVQSRHSTTIKYNKKIDKHVGAQSTRRDRRARSNDNAVAVFAALAIALAGGSARRALSGFSARGPSTASWYSFRPHHHA